MKKILLVFGTRPEAIKMCPLVRECLSRQGFETAVCVTGQHREMLDTVLSTFAVTPQYDLSVMTEGQTLFAVTQKVLGGMESVLQKASPSLVLVHGDTASAFAAALAAFYLQIPIGHVEAGLRTYDIHAPFPEEFYRTAISRISYLDFAPTEHAKDNLLREGKARERIFVTGNTAVDALRYTVRDDFSHPILDWAKGSRTVLLTAHRRENIGEPMRRIFRAVKSILAAHADVKIICPVHKNPAVRQAAEQELGGIDRIRLIEPPDVFIFHNLLARAHLILTDSGGIQEEASALGKPVLVLRDTTERPEGVWSGNLIPVGTEEESILRAFAHLLKKDARSSITTVKNPYGDGYASRRIADIIEKM